MPPTAPVSQAQLLLTQIKLLESDRARHIERHSQALHAIDNHIRTLRERLASIADEIGQPNEAAADRFEL